MSLVKMKEEINSPCVSSESLPLAPGKLAVDKLTVGILFPHFGLKLQSVFYSMASPVEITDFLITRILSILINWISDICLQCWLICQPKWEAVFNIFSAYVCLYRIRQGLQHI